MKTPLLSLLLVLLAHTAPAQEPAPLGQERVLTAVILPGPELVPRPDPLNRAPARLRLTSVTPHGTLGFRYTIAYVGMEPGTHDLAKLLQRADGSEPGELPAVPVEIKGILAPGKPGPLPAPESPVLPALGGYRLLIGAALAVWAVVLAWILSGLRKPPAPPAAVSPAASPADRLRPLLLLASEGKLDASGRAEFERILLGFWSKRLGDSELPVAERLAKLRRHPEAGPLLLLAESWLHAPPGRAGADAEQRIAEALAPLVRA